MTTTTVKTTRYAVSDNEPDGNSLVLVRQKEDDETGDFEIVVEQDDDQIIMRREHALAVYEALGFLLNSSEA